jgi:hypothetical protein
MAADIGKYVRDIFATSSLTVIIDFIHRATTKCSWAFWSTKPVKMMYIDYIDHIVVRLKMMQGQISLMLCWCSFSRLGREHVAFSFSYKGSQYYVYDHLQPVATETPQDTWALIIHAPVMIIFKMVQRGYLNLICQWRQPETPIWHLAMYRQSDNPRPKTENHWHSVDIDFNIFNSDFLLPWIMVEVIIWTLVLPFCLVENQPIGKV